MLNAALILDQLLPLDAVNLGNLVSHPRDPIQSPYRPESNTFTDDDIVTQQLSDFNQVLDRVQGSRFHAFILSMLRGEYNNSKIHGIDISSTLCVTRRLRNPDDTFQMVCQQPSARRWLESAARRRQDVYLVVGVKTLTDAQVVHERSRSKETGLSVELPAALVTTAATGMPLPLDGLLDTGVGVTRPSETRHKISFVAPGEQVFAVQYRKIAFARFSRRDIDEASLLTKNSWRVYVGARGKTEGEGEVLETSVHEYMPQKEAGDVSLEVLTLDDGEELYAFS